MPHRTPVVDRTAPRRARCWNCGIVVDRRTAGTVDLLLVESLAAQRGSHTGLPADCMTPPRAKHYTCGAPACQ
jgi:hypothetical protein